MAASDEGTAEPTAVWGIQSYQLEFSGDGGEYFRVWIVNVLLTIVTFGFYTPFARRRTAQYFYGHTLVAGSPLEFTAQQKKMFLGFVIMVALYLTFQVASETGEDVVAGLMLLAGALAAPYFWGSAMRFRLGATRWRGVRLQFTAGWSEVYRAAWPVFVIAGAWFLAFLVTGALMPDEDAATGANGGAMALAILSLLAAFVVTIACIIRLEFNANSLLVARGRIGGQAGRWKPVFSDFVRIWLATVGVFLGGALVFALVVALVVGGSFASITSLRQGDLGAIGGIGGVILAMIAGVVAFLLGLVLASAPARAYREARMFQLVWNNIGISQIARFKCDLQTRRFVWLRVRNLLLTIFTLGFYRPFALVSEYRMKAESVTVHVKGGLDQLAGQLAREEEGLGDAMAGAVGLDLVG